MRFALTTLKREVFARSRSAGIFSRRPGSSDAEKSASSANFSGHTKASNLRKSRAFSARRVSESCLVLDSLSRGTRVIWYFRAGLQANRTGHPAYSTGML